MDPNKALTELREVMTELAPMLNDGVPDGAEYTINEAVERFTALDEWLSRNGFLPIYWTRRFPSVANALDVALEEQRIVPINVEQRDRLVALLENAIGIALQQEQASVQELLTQIPRADAIKQLASGLDEALVAIRELTVIAEKRGTTRSIPARQEGPPPGLKMSARKALSWQRFKAVHPDRAENVRATFLWPSCGCRPCLMSYGNLMPADVLATLSKHRQDKAWAAYAQVHSISTSMGAFVRTPELWPACFCLGCQESVWEWLPDEALVYVREMQANHRADEERRFGEQTRSRWPGGA